MSTARVRMRRVRLGASVPQFKSVRQDVPYVCHTWQTGIRGSAHADTRRRNIATAKSRSVRNVEGRARRLRCISFGRQRCRFKESQKRRRLRCRRTTVAALAGLGNAHGHVVRSRDNQRRRRGSKIKRFTGSHPRPIRLLGNADLCGTLLCKAALENGAVHDRRLLSATVRS